MTVDVHNPQQTESKPLTTDLETLAPEATAELSSDHNATSSSSNELIPTLPGAPAGSAADEPDYDARGRPFWRGPGLARHSRIAQRGREIPGVCAAKRLFKFHAGYTDADAYNALSDLSGPDLLLYCLAFFPNMHTQLCTADRNLALFWVGAGASDIKRIGDGIEFTMTLMRPFYREVMPNAGQPRSRPLPELICRPPRPRCRNSSKRTLVRRTGADGRRRLMRLAGPRTTPRSAEPA